jgi:release factor glutamine methyltransferase
VGKVDFFGAEIHVDRRALIPRVETEWLVDLTAKQLRKEAMSLLDLCSGSGCIGICLKKKFPPIQVSLSDLSSDAMALAQENAARNGVELEFCIGDFFSPFQGRKVDAIVCNPPYISTKEFLNLDPSVRDFEPKMALIGGEDGADFYRRLSLEAPDYLTPQGQLFLEIGWDQGGLVQEIFPSSVWKKQLLQDLSGKDRFFFLEKQ